LLAEQETKIALSLGWFFGGFLASFFGDLTKKPTGFFSVSPWVSQP